MPCGQARTNLTVTCQPTRAVLRIASIAADLRFGAVRVKGRACSIACDAGGALDARWAGPHFSMIASGAMRSPQVGVSPRTRPATCNGWPGHHG